MANLLFPKPLKLGEVVSIISPSSPASFYCPKRFFRGIKMIELMGYKVKIEKNVRKRLNHTTKGVDERVSDIHSAFSDKSVKAIICTIGGMNSNALIERLDYELIKKNPKIFCGFSDITVLQLAILKMTGLVTFSGPALLPTFADYPEIQEFSRKHFVHIINNIGKNDLGKLPVSDKWTDEYLAWDIEDDKPKKLKINNGWKILKTGQSRGFLVGGNLSAMMTLAGTKYWPDFNDKILFIDIDDEEKSSSVDRYLTQLNVIRVFNKIKGLLIGRLHSKTGFKKKKYFEDLLMSIVDNFYFPIIINMDFGHTDPILTLPVGILVEIDTRKPSVQLLTH